MAFECQNCGNVMNVMHTPLKCTKCKNEDVSKFVRVPDRNISDEKKAELKKELEART